MKRKSLARDGLLVLVTVAATAAVLVPFSSASRESRGDRTLTARVGDTVRFARLDWECTYFYPANLPTGGGKTVFVPRYVNCGRESTSLGVHTDVDGETVELERWVKRKVGGRQLPVPVTIMTVKRNP
jgi:hypothetical protein